MSARRLSARRASPAFSVVAIVRDEAARLPRLVASFAEFSSRGGEVLVLDTGSSDGTPTLAREAACRVFVEPRRFNTRLTEGQAERIQSTFARGGEGPFLAAGQRVFRQATARNHAAFLARNDFQLAVDGSDQAEALDLDYLDATVRSGEFQILRFETRRLHEGRWFIENRNYFHDRRAIRWDGRAHNFVTPVVSGTVPTVIQLPRDRLRIAHHTAPKGRNDQLAAVALDALKAPHSVHRGYLVGRELAIRGHYHSALAAFLALDRGDVQPALRSAALGMAASCLAEIAEGGSEDEVAGLLFKALRCDSTRRDPFLQLARRCVVAGDFQGAVSFASAALVIPPRVGFAELEENQREGPHAVLYWALFWLGRKSEAHEHLKICLNLDPRNPVYRDHARLFA